MANAPQPEDDVRRKALAKWRLAAANVVRYYERPVRYRGPNDGEFPAGQWWGLWIQRTPGGEWELACRRRSATCCGSATPRMGS